MDEIIQRLIDKKRELNVSNGWIAEKSGIPEATVTKILNGSTKSPGTATVAPIAAVLGVSVGNDEDESVERDERYIALLLENYEKQTERLVKNYEKQLRSKDMWIRALAIALAAVVAFIFGVVIYDISNLDMGWVRYQQALGNMENSVRSAWDLIKNIR